jgi:hypothetical protein
MDCNLRVWIGLFIIDSHEPSLFSGAGAVEMGTVHAAVFCENIPDAAGGFVADCYSAVTVFHLAITNNDVFRRRSDAPAIPIASRFDGDESSPVSKVQFSASKIQHAGEGLNVATAVNLPFP